MLPDCSGLDICKKVTESYNIPILMITAKSDITDKVLGLEFGADDYITKPFDLREVVARIRTILRRLEQAHHLNERETAKAHEIRTCIKLFSKSLNMSIYRTCISCKIVPPDEFQKL